MRGRAIGIAVTMAAAFVACQSAAAAPSLLPAPPVVGPNPVGGAFSCVGESLVGTITGQGLYPGQLYRAAYVHSGAIAAEDTSAHAADANGIYVSRTLTLPYPLGNEDAVEILQENVEVESAPYKVTCTPPVIVNATATRSCATGTVSGTVSAKWLTPSGSHWQVAYTPSGEYLPVGNAAARGLGAITTFAITIENVPIDATRLPMRLAQIFAPSSPPKTYAFTISLTNCTKDKLSTSAVAAHASAPRSSTTSSSSASATASSTTDSARSSTAGGSTVASGGLPGQPGGVGTPDLLSASAAAAHKGTSSSAGEILLIALVLGLAVLGLAGFFVYRYQRTGPGNSAR